MISLLAYRECENSVEFGVFIGSLAHENGQCNVEELPRHLFDYCLVDALVGEASFHDLLPPSSDVAGHLLPEDSAVFGKLVLLCEAVNNVIGFSCNNLDSLLLADFGVVAFKHAHGGFKCRGQLVLQLVLPKNVTQTQGSDIVEELRLLHLIG